MSSASIRSFLESVSGASFSDQDDLIKKGIINSLQIMEVISHIEATYGVEVQAEDIVSDNFSSVERIVALVERLRT